MADLSLGRTRSSNNGSQDSLLNSIKSVVASDQFKGQKIDENAVNKILQLISENAQNAADYNLALTSANNDALVEKIKDVISKLYDAQSKSASDSSKSSAPDAITADDVAKAILPKIQDAISKIQIPENTSVEKEESNAATSSESQIFDTAELEKKLDEIKEVTGEDDSNVVDSPIKEGKDGDYTNTDIASNFVKLQSLIEQQVSTLNQTVVQISEQSQKWFKINFSNPFDMLTDKLFSFGSSAFKYVSAQFDAVKAKFKDVTKNMLDKIKSPFKALGAKISGIGAGLLNKIKSPFKAIGTKFKSLGASLKKGFGSVLKGVGGALKGLGAGLLKGIGGALNAINPLRLFKKKKKPTKEEIKLSKMIDKVNNFIDNFFDTMLGYVDKFLEKVLKKAKMIVNQLMTHILAWLFVNVALIGLLIAIILKLIADPFMKILQPIMDFVESLVTKILDFLAPIRDFLINVLQKAWEIISIPLEGLMKGIGTVAEALGRALGKLIIGIADFFVDTLLPFLRDKLLPVLGAALDVIKEFFKAIEPWIRPLVDTVLRILKTFLDAIEPWIRPLVDVVMATLVTILGILKRLLDEVGEILISIAKIIKTPIKMVADFFEGLGSKAKEIGQKVGDIVLKVLTKIEGALDGLINTVRLYVVAPLIGIKRKLAALKVNLAEKFSFKLPSIEWVGLRNGGLKVKWVEVKPFSFLTGGMTKQQIEQAHADKEKPVSELISEEMAKMEEKIAAEEEAAHAAELAKKLEKAKIDSLLKNQNQIGDILAYTKASKDQLDQISQQMGLESIEVDLNKEVEIDLSKIEEKSKDKANEFSRFKNDMYAYIGKLGESMKTNFELVLEKLDKKPNLLPIPMMNPNDSNLTMMEGM